MGPGWIIGFVLYAFLGSLNVCSGESSTQTLFLRVMDTFDDDDDDDFNTSTLQHFETSLSTDVQLLENYYIIFLHCWCSLFTHYFQYNIGWFILRFFLPYFSITMN